jgi:hypothetical protein
MWNKSVSQESHVFLSRVEAKGNQSKTTKFMKVNAVSLAGGSQRERGGRRGDKKEQ